MGIFKTILQEIKEEDRARWIAGAREDHAAMLERGAKFRQAIQETKNRPPIPYYCLKDCIYRDKKAKHAPACTYAGRIAFNDDFTKCLTYKKQ